MDFLAAFLHGGSEDITSEAALALGSSRMPEAVEALERAWEQTRDPELRFTVARAIGASRLERGLEFLLKTQHADGSWQVLSRIHDDAPVSPPYFETGFPHGKNQFTSCSGTSWAAMALSLALPAANVTAFSMKELVPPVEPWVETALFGSADEVRTMDDFRRLSRNASKDRANFAGFRLVSPGYFQAMGIPLIRGREFLESDAPDAPHVAVISQSLAQTKWGDRQRWTLEDRLPQLMRELETQAVEAEERRLAKEREEAERRRQWEVAMDRAKLRLIEDHRREVLRRRVTAWTEADAIRAYCEAVEARHGAHTIAADSEAAEWLAFAREHADHAIGRSADVGDRCARAHRLILEPGEVR